MRNQEIAQLLYDIADLLELKDENVFKIRAYRKAAQSIEALTKPVEDYYKKDELNEIPGIGRGIAEKIIEFLEKGRSDYYEKMKKSMPMDFENLMRIEGLGPKKIRILYSRLKIKSVKDLENAAKTGKIRKLQGFGEKTEENILKGIQFSKKSGLRMPLGFALPIAEDIIKTMKNLHYVKHADYAGSLRRMKETIGDIDILVTASSSQKIVDHFVGMKDVIDVIAKGSTKASIHITNGMQVDLRVLPENQYGSALLYFTGSKEHNIELRKIAIAKKMKLSEYGLFKNDKIVAGKTENEVYKALGLSYIEPEMREARGEIKLSMKGKLPKILNIGDIAGDLQMHTKWSDGANTIEEMALACIKLGYEYICITDHAGKLKIANALDEKRLEKQKKEIDKINEKIDGIKILHGMEVDINMKGDLDIRDAVLKNMDFVLASLHSGLKQPREKNTERVLKAIENHHVDIFAHPTGRLLGKREGADIDMQAVIKKAVETDTVIEINAQPDRLDMNDINTMAAREAGCKIMINTDAHSIDQLNFMKLGVAVARRAWCGKKDILNTMSCKDFCKAFDISN